jgi:hypothetical protein
MFIQLHGNLPLLEIKRPYARTFRETLQLVPRHRKGKLLKASLKTKTSERVVPVHPQLVNLGFLKYVAARCKESEQAWLFPTVSPAQAGALSLVEVVGPLGEGIDGGD